MGRLHYTVREGQEGNFEGPTVEADYQHPGPNEPERGDLLRLDGRWRVVDYMRTDKTASYANFLVVKNEVPPGTAPGELAKALSG
jgi:hypothetical protein